MTADQISQNSPNRKSARFLMFEFSSESANFWFDISNAILLFGAVLVAFGTFGTIKLAGVKEKFSDERIAANEAETRQAIADSDTAKEGTALANKQIAELSIQEEQLRKDTALANARAAEATLALEKLKTPRTLGSTRQQSIAAAVKPFKGQRYRAAISQGADDGVVFWESLYVTLENAGWIYLPIAPGQISVGHPPAGVPIAAVPGIEIVFDPAKEKELSAAALALGTALHADGTVVAVSRDNQSNPDETQRDIILIRIGARVPRG